MKVPVLIPLVLTLALIACGDKQENPATAPATPLPVAKPLPTACQLVTAADVQVAFGQVVEVMEDAPETCIYNGIGDTAAFILLTTSLIPNESTAEATEMFSMMLKMWGGMNEVFNEKLGANNTTPAQTLAGVGDESWFKVGDTNPLAITQAMVRKGTVVLSIAATGMDAKEVPKFEALVHKVVEKL